MAWTLVRIRNVKFKLDVAPFRGDGGENVKVTVKVSKADDCLTVQWTQVATFQPVAHLMSPKRVVGGVYFWRSELVCIKAPSRIVSWFERHIEVHSGMHCKQTLMGLCLGLTFASITYADHATSGGEVARLNLSSLPLPENERSS